MHKYLNRGSHKITHKTKCSSILGLSATYNYYLYYGTVNLKKECFSLAQIVRDEMDENPFDGSNVYIFLSKNLKIFKILTEQICLLNNRSTDNRSQEKNDFDGNSSSTKNNGPYTPTETPSKKDGKSKRQRKNDYLSEDKHIDRTVTHKLDEYHSLLDGVHYLTRDGKTDMMNISRKFATKIIEKKKNINL